MNLVSAHTHRVLAYIEATSRHGQPPSPEAVNAFGENPDRWRDIGYFRLPPGLTGAAALAARFVSTYDDDVPSEEFTAYLERCGWTAVGALGVTLTALGRALLMALNAPVLDDETDSIVEVVLGPDDPFAYARAIETLGGAQSSMLVDAYFRFDQLLTIDGLSNIERVLTWVKGQHRAALSAALAAFERPIEVRTTSGIHDRFLIPRVGSVLSLGSSLNGLRANKKISTITQFGDVASMAIRTAHESLWEAAEPVPPLKPQAT